MSNGKCTVEEAQELKMNLELKIRDELEKFSKETKIVVTKVKVKTIDYGHEGEKQLAFEGTAPIYDTVTATAEL